MGGRIDAFRSWVPTEIEFGRGCVNESTARLRSVGHRPFVVTGPTSGERSGAVADLREALPNAVVFNQVEENPSMTVCERAAVKCRVEECDVVIGVGGGSPMDCAKAVAVLADNRGRCKDFVGSDKFVHALPIVTVPTTAGTGSEVTPFSVLVNPDTNEKQTIRGRKLFPELALLDPQYTVSMPRPVTVNTGLDALSQGMEGLVSKNATPFSDIVAIEVCRVVGQWLPVVASEPDNIDARSQMLFAAMLSGWVVAHAQTTLVHGMGYRYTTHHGVAHGLANALLLTPVFQFNARHAPDKVAAIAKALGVPDSGDCVRDVAVAIHGLLAKLGVSPAAKDAGVPEDVLDDYATAIFNDKNRLRNQIGCVELEDIRNFYRASYAGSGLS